MHAVKVFDPLVVEYVHTAADANAVKIGGKFDIKFSGIARFEVIGMLRIGHKRNFPIETKVRRCRTIGTCLQVIKFVDDKRNADFCCMTETWSYRRAYAELDALVYSLKYDGMFNRLVFDSPSRVCEHQISPKKGVEMKGRMVVWDRNFSLVPEAFLGSEPPEIEIDTKVLLDEGLYLCYKGKNRQHLFQSVYLEAQKVAEDKANTVFFWWFSSTLYVVLFKKQQLQFANIFDVSSASEVAYFILAATQECGMHQEAFSLVGDAESENLQLLDTELEKLGIQVLAVNRSDLYPGYFNSPQQILSGYLYHMPQCALPEAY